MPPFFAKEIPPAILSHFFLSSLVTPSSLPTGHSDFRSDNLWAGSQAIIQGFSLSCFFPFPIQACRGKKLPSKKKIAATTKRVS